MKAPPWLLAAAVALAAPIAFLAWLEPGLPPDDVDLVVSGWNALHGRGLRTPFGPLLLHPPLPALLAGAAVTATGSWELGPRAVSVLLGAVAAALAATSAARAGFSPRAALLAGLVVALDPGSIRASTVIAPLRLFEVLLLAFGLILAQSIDRGAWLPAASAVLAAAYLVRPEAAFLALPAIAVLATARRRGGGGHRAAHVLAAVAVAIALAAPYLAYLHGKTGRLWWNGKGRYVYFWAVTPPPFPWPPWPQPADGRAYASYVESLGSPLRHAASDPLGQARRIAGNAATELRLLAPVLAVGLWLGWTDGRRAPRRGDAALLCPLFLLLLYPPLWVSGRFTMPLLGTSALAAMCAGSCFSRTVRPASWLLPLLALPIAGLARVPSRPPAAATIERRLASHLIALGGSGATLTNSYAVSFLARDPALLRAEGYRLLFPKDLPRAGSIAAERGAAYVALVAEGGPLPALPAGTEVLRLTGPTIGGLQGEAVLVEVSAAPRPVPAARRL